MGGRLKSQLKPRKILFWLHLSAGCIAGAVILVMSITGVLLAFERQINAWSDSKFHVTAAPDTARLPIESLLYKVAQAAGAAPSAMTVRADPRAPIEFSFGREKIIFADPYSGAVLGEHSRALRQFFEAVEKWHRALGAQLGRSSWGRSATGACNFVFALLVCSGLYLWLPKKWNWTSIRPALWFRRGVRGKARNWNWHNTAGIWSALPLLLITVSGVIMSYPWANNLLYKAAGSPVPQANAQSRPAAGERPAQRARSAGGDVGLDRLFQKAEQRVPGWHSVSLQGLIAGPAVFSIDTGNGGQPNKRAQLTLDRANGKVIRWEPFSSQTLGRRLRSYARFGHTGEAAGLPGQIVAAFASMGGALLVWTGISLALRRLRNRLRKVDAQRTTAEPAAIARN
jgi:uncharacterized iron-regulated membrane protein